MRRTLLVCSVLAAASCSKKTGDQATPTPASGPGSASGTGSAPAPAPPDAAPGCDLAGDYRLRHHSNGADGWWFRFRVSGTPPKAELTEKSVMLDVPAGPIDLAADPAACKLTVTTKSEHAGDIKVAVALDVKTGAVTGQLTRSKTTDPTESPAAISGVRDLGPPTAPACIHPGVYKLELDTSGKWKNPEPGDKRSCKDVSADVLPFYVRVEPLAGALVIDEVSSDAPYQQDFGRGTVTTTSECAYTLALANEHESFEAALTFAGDKITGSASKAQVQIVEDGEAGENLWDCASKQVAVTGERVAN